MSTVCKEPEWGLLLAKAAHPSLVLWPEATGCRLRAIGAQCGRGGCRIQGWGEGGAEMTLSRAG